MKHGAMAMAMAMAIAMPPALGMLAGCGQPASTGKNGGPSPTASDPMEARLAAATDVQRRVAFLRGILDAGYQCRKITKVEGLPRDASGHPMWHIVCDDAADYTIVLVPGGIFNVSGVPGPTKPRFPSANGTPVAR